MNLTIHTLTPKLEAQGYCKGFEFMENVSSA